MNNGWIAGIAALLPLCFVVTGAEGAIYRCKQADGSVLYTDYPCQGGAVVDVQPGTADPNTRERLARAQAELDRATADRRAREQFEAARREVEARQNVGPPPAPPNDAYPVGAYDFYTPIAGYAPSDRLRSGAHGMSHKPRGHDKHVPQVVRIPHPPR